MRGSLLRIPVAEVDETFIGSPLLVTVDGTTYAGGLSDIEPHARGDMERLQCGHVAFYTDACRWLYLAGALVLVPDTAFVVCEPSPTALAAVDSEPAT